MHEKSENALAVGSILFIYNLRCEPFFYLVHRQSRAYKLDKIDGSHFLFFTKITAEIIM